MSEEKKIVVDEDWKAQVEAEKAAQQTEPNDTTDPAKLSPAQEAAAQHVMPPATLETLIGTLATEATIALGQFAHPATGKVQISLEQAKYVIDIIAMLQEKTKGNITPEETSGISDLLHQLRMLYIATQSQVGSTTSNPKPDIADSVEETKPESKIILE